MGKFTVSHEFRCSEETFWKTFLDRDFNLALYREHLGFPAYDIVEVRETDGEIVRKVQGMPKMNMPGPLVKLFGSGFSYVEDGTFDKNTKLWRWKMTPSTLADKLRNEGTMRVEKLGEDRVRRIAEIEIEAKIFGVGGLIESTSEKQLREGWDASAPFMQQWMDSHE